MAARSGVIWLYVALGGAAGAVARFALAEWITARAHGAFPWGTFAVNVLGSLVLGAVLGAYPSSDAWAVRSLLAVGFCGAFTTFSTFGFETVGMLEMRAYGLAAAYVGASLLVGMLAVVFGLWAGARLAE